MPQPFKQRRLTSLLLQSQDDPRKLPQYTSLIGSITDSKSPATHESILGRPYIFGYIILALTLDSDRKIGQLTENVVGAIHCLTI